MNQTVLYHVQQRILKVWAFSILLAAENCFAADKALLDTLLLNQVISKNQYDTLTQADSPATESSSTLLDILKENGAITQEQYAGLVKAAIPPGNPEKPIPAPELIHAHGGMTGGGAPEPNRVGKEVMPGINATFGGFVELAGIYRSKNQSQDVNSNLNTSIPFDNSSNAHQAEFRESARSSRISLLLDGNYNENTKLSSYLEMDFLGISSANSVQTTSYSPRLRLGYATINQTDWGFHFLGGQAWSLLTTNKNGINPRAENLPLSIDGGFIPGFNYTRSPQLRFVQDFANHEIWAGLSLESPQMNLAGISVPSSAYGNTAGVTASNPGGGALSPAVNYSTDIAPDIIAKLAFDPGWGHYELFGITRFFHSTINNTANSTLSNHNVEGIGGGMAAILPIVPGMLEMQLNFMGGSGIGRYSSALLPDAAFSTTGALVPLTEYTGLLGIIAHPDSRWDIYTYLGGEMVNRYNQPIASDNSAPLYGYGNTNLINAGCGVLGGTCNAQTASVWQVSPGFWTTLYGGNAGTIKSGLQYSYSRRNAFSGLGGIAPHTDENIMMLSFRYYPLQK